MLRLRGGGDAPSNDEIEAEWERANADSVQRAADVVNKARAREFEAAEAERARVKIVDGDEVFDPKGERHMNRTRSKPVEDAFKVVKGNLDDFPTMFDGEDVGRISEVDSEAEGEDSGGWGPSERCWLDGDEDAAKALADSDVSTWEEEEEEDSQEQVIEREVHAHQSAGALLSDGCSGLLQSLRAEYATGLPTRVREHAFVFVGNMSLSSTLAHWQERLQGMSQVDKVLVVERREEDPRGACLFGERRRKRAIEDTGDEKEGAAKRQRAEDSESEEARDETEDWLAQMGIESRREVKEQPRRKPREIDKVDFGEVGLTMVFNDRSIDGADTESAGDDAAPEQNATGSTQAAPLAYVLAQCGSKHMAAAALREIRGEAQAQGAVCELAWGEEEFVDRCVSSASSRVELVQLLSRQLGAGLSGLSGHTCAGALRALSRLPPTQWEERFRSKKAKVRYPRSYPHLPALVSPAYQPHNKLRCQQQELVAALLTRILSVSTTMSTASLASVLRVVTSLDARHLELPSGVDWRVAPPTIGDEKNRSQPFFGRHPGAYGYIGLTTRVIRMLSTIRGGAVMEAFTGYPWDCIPPQVCASGLSKHAQKQRDYPSLHPFVPGRYFEGHDGVYGAYTARSGGAKAWRQWLGFGPDRAEVGEAKLKRVAKKLDRNIELQERKYWKRYMELEFGVFGDAEIEAYMKEHGMRNWTQSVYRGEGGVRIPLESCWFDEDPLEAPSDAPSDEPEDTWMPAPLANLTFGYEDPLYGRWVTKENPPFVRPYMERQGMSKTTELHLRSVAELKAQGRPYVVCAGGVQVPTDPEVIRKICTPEPIENLYIKPKPMTREEIESIADPQWAYRRTAKMRKMEQLATRSNHSMSEFLRSKMRFVKDDFLEPKSRVTKRGFERAEQVRDNPLRLRGFGSSELEEDDSEDDSEEASSGPDSVLPQQQRTGEDRWDSIYQKYFMGPEEWDAKAKSVLDRLQDENGPMFNGTELEKRQLAEDMAEQLTGKTIPEWMVVRVMHRQKNRLRQRAVEVEETPNEVLPPSEDDTLVDYTKFDKEANERELHQLILNEKLMLAVDARDPHQITELINAGADVNYYDAEFQFCCPLHLAASQDDPLILRLLLALGADVEVRDVKGATPLHEAAANGQTESVVELVSQRGADVNALDHDFRGALHVCCGRGHLDTVEALLKLSAHPDQKTDIGDTPLIAACAWGQVEVMEMLLDHGADGNVTNKLMVSPLEIVREYGFDDAERLLLERGVQDMDVIARRWDALWAQLEDAARAGLLGNATRIDSKTARRHATVLMDEMERLRNEPSGEFSDFLRAFWPTEPPDKDIAEQRHEMEALAEMKALRRKVEGRGKRGKRKRGGEGDDSAAEREDDALAFDPRFSML